MLYSPPSEVHGLGFSGSFQCATVGDTSTSSEGCPHTTSPCRRRPGQPGARGLVPPRVRPALQHHRRRLRSSLWGRWYSINSTAAASRGHIFSPAVATTLICRRPSTTRFSLGCHGGRRALHREGDRGLCCRVPTAQGPDQARDAQGFRRPRCVICVLWGQRGA
jgi:hypothetical protein